MGGFPAYHDAQKHMFLYRRREPASWVICNRLGSGRGVLTVFAENADDVPKPYLAKQPWTVSAWANRSAEADPDISVYLSSDSGSSAGVATRDGVAASLGAAPPPSQLAVRSKASPEVVGAYMLLSDETFNDHIVYERVAKEQGTAASEQLEASERRYIFWDAERWCIGDSIGAPASHCYARSQKRNFARRDLPDDAVWQGVEILRGDCARIHPSLLASLKGRVSSMSKQFES
eukprot:TRINITY_DN31871_c0_g1_i1.p1 TRINITY_DN31871_c0_g1~~TRINITY_DN31871_c0_g1_i1.p1  ORF type:complete len:233 (-),score=43.79 TRINITY_DN31871_c0_g1_i1:238-936(-)